MYISWDQGQDPEWEKNDMFSKLDLNDTISLKILIKVSGDCSLGTVLDM